MKTAALASFVIVAACFSAIGEDDAESIFFADIAKAQQKYRASYAETLRKADRTIVYLVDFEIKAPSAIGEDSIYIPSYKKSSKILATKELKDEEGSKMLEALARQVAKPDHTGGAFCHFPIHGIRIYRKGEEIYEGTFCWACSNFSFAYPGGDSEWLDTSEELKQVFLEVLPIPEEELERFRKKFPESRPEPKKEAPEAENAPEAN